MKFLHLSDLHLGKRLIDVSLYEDQAYILDEIVRVAGDEQVQAVLIAGDVYDRSNPSSEAMALFGRFVHRLTQLGCKVLVISGNHDSSERVAYFGELVSDAGVYLSPVYNGHISPIETADEYGPVAFYLMPFIHYEAARRFFPDAKIENANDAAKLVLDEIRPDPAFRNVILSHQLILGSVFDEREQRSVGTLDNVDAELYDAFDYVALGHIHKAQNVGRDNGTMRYCGTPLKYSKKEALSEKSVTVVELREKGSVSVRTVPLTPLRELRLIRGSFDAVMERGPEPGTEGDYFFITLTDDEDILHAASRLRERFGLVLDVDFDNARTRSEAGLSIDGIPDIEEKTPLELIMELYRLTHSTDMSEEARAFTEKMIRETEGFDL